MPQKTRARLFLDQENLFQNMTEADTADQQHRSNAATATATPDSSSVRPSPAPGGVTMHSVKRLVEEKDALEKRILHHRAMLTVRCFPPER